jgi:hypothetical protein
MHSSRTVVLFLLTFLVLSMMSAQAAVIYLNSDSTANDPRQYNDQTHDNIAITPNPAWNPNGSDYFWISYTNSGNGPGAVQIPNATSVDAAPTATFYLDFILNSAASSGSVTVWADDTARVYMDDTLLIDANPVPGSACSDGPVSCATNNGAVLDLTHLNLQAGEHQLRIEAYQLSGSVFGVQYAGSITEGGIAETPEPATFAVLGTALIGLGVVLRRRRVSNS